MPPIQASRKLAPFFKDFILGEAASSRPPALSELLLVGLGATGRLMLNSLQLLMDPELKRRTRLLGSDPWADTDFSARFSRSCLPPSVGGMFSCRQLLGTSLTSRISSAVTCASAVQGGDEQHMHMYLPVRAGIESGAILRCYRNLAQRVRVVVLPPLQLALPALGERGKSRICELPSCLKDFEGVLPAEIAAVKNMRVALEEKGLWGQFQVHVTGDVALLWWLRKACKHAVRSTPESVEPVVVISTRLSHSVSMSVKKRLKS